jgi:GTPase Era involved in 16S rRNA processing
MKEQNQLIAALKELESLASESTSRTLLPQIDDEIDKLETSSFYLAVLGQFKRGKTTFINALLGEEILPTGILPLTSIITLIRFGERKKAEVVFLDNRRCTIDPTELRQYVSESENAKNEKKVHHVELAYPSSFLKNGIVLIDTPGVGSIALHNTETTQGFLPRIEAAVVLLGADPPVTQVEFQFIDELFSSVEKAFFLLNKSDVLSESDLADALAYTASALKSKLGSNSEVYPVSALAALKERKGANVTGPYGSAIEKVKRTIESFLQKEKLHHLLRSSEKRFHRFIEELRFSIELQLKAIETPLNELQTKIGLFNQYATSLETDGRRHIYIIDGEITLLRQRLSDKVDLKLHEEASKLQNAIENFSSKHSDMPSNDLLMSLDQEVTAMLISDFEKWRMPVQTEILESLRSIFGRAAEEVNELSRKINQHTAELFGISVKEFPSVELLPLKDEFSYRTKDDPLFIDVDTEKLSSWLLPRALARRKVIRHVMKKTAEKVNINSGRVLSDFVTVIENNKRYLQHHFESDLKLAIGDINRILDDALRRRIENESTVAEQVSVLGKRLLRVAEIEASLDRSVVELG